MIGGAGPDFVIEPFRSTDVVAALRLVQRSLGEELPYTFFLQMSGLRPEFCKVARHPLRDQMLGLIVGTRESGCGARVLLFAVDPEAQGQGVGHALLRSLQSAMTLEDVRQVELEVRTDNARAIEFYRRHGFQVMGLQERAYRDGGDAYRMSKALV